MVKHLLFAMRHGQTRWNAEGRFQGRSDHPLTVEGRRQAARNGRKLKAHLERLRLEPSQIAVYASPLGRARETTDAAVVEMGIPESRVNVDARLAEASFGHWEGMTTLEVKASFPAERRLRKADRWNFDRHGGDSYADLARRMAGFLSDLDPGHPALVVSHAGNIKVLAGMLMGMAQEDVMAFRVPHDVLFCWDGKGLSCI